MGYDLHITRAKRWSDQEPSISADEWLAYVDRDPELQLNGKYFALWAGVSRQPDPWFDWSDGHVHTKNPDPAVIAKAIQIASRLGAAVQGDDGEVYLPEGKVQIDGVVDASPSMDWRNW
jgi:hypothetical protein